MKKKQIVIFGGCFNPPLNSHFLLAQQVVEEYEQVEKIVFVPVNSQYQKIDLISNEHRYQMLKRECNQNEKFELSTIELKSNRPLYTIETLRKLQKEYKEYEIAFMIGSDNLKELETWKMADELLNEFKVYVVKREKDDLKKIIQKSQFLSKNQQAIIKVRNGITSNLSSTLVREKIREQKSIKYLTTNEIVSYIEENKLYQKEED